MDVVVKFLLMIIDYILKSIDETYEGPLEGEEHKFKPLLPKTTTNKVLFILLIMHAFYENDGQFNKLQKKEMKLYLKDHKGVLDPTENKLLPTLIKIKPDINKIHAYMDNNDIHTFIVEDILDQLYIAFEDIPEFRKVINSLKLNIL